MWESIKNDPIIRTVVIFFLGILGLGFAWNIMFGTRLGYGMEHGAGMGINGGTGMYGTGMYGTGGFSLEYLVAILFKILMLVLVVTIVAALIKFVIRAIGNHESFCVHGLSKNDSLVRLIAILGLSLILLYVLVPVLGGVFGGMGYYHYPMDSYPGITLTGILASLLKVLLTVSVIGVVVGLTMFLYQNYSARIVELIKLPEQAKTGLKCSSCNEDLKANWKCCPACGTVKEGIVKEETVKEEPLKENAIRENAIRENAVKEKEV